MLLKLLNLIAFNKASHIEQGSYALKKKGKKWRMYQEKYFVTIHTPFHEII